MTVTLQDVIVLLGLRIDDPPITGTDERDLIEECDRLLGVVPPPTAIHTRQVKLTWLRKQFTVPPITDVEAQQYALAYMLHMIDTQLFPDYSKNKVYLRWLPLLEDFDVCEAMSWGNAVLAYLYRSLYSISMMQTSLFSEHGELLHVL